MQELRRIRSGIQSEQVIKLPVDGMCSISVEMCHVPCIAG